MTTRRLAVLTLWSVALFALAAAFSLQAEAGATSETSTETFDEIAIAPVDVSVDAPPAIQPVEEVREPALIVEATPVTPPTWVAIPEDLITEPTPPPGSDTATPLPYLTNITSAPRDGSVVYLTFDDGPHPTYTNQILDLLAQYNAKATFFVLGSAVDTHPGIAQRIAAEGHAFGNHTYYHEALPRESAETVSQTLSATNNAIARATGRTTSCMRPPYGALDQATYDIAQSLGYSISMWEVDSNDWRTTDGYTIAASVLRDTNLGNRVLFHDGPANRAGTVQAVASVLEVLSNRGVQFHALPSCGG